MLKTSNLSLGYDAVSLVKLAGFVLEAGEHCLITGKSGSGKTTLLLTFAGILPPVQGTVSVNEQNVTAMPEAARDVFRGKHIGFVFQALHLMPLLSVEDNLKLAFYSAKIPILQSRIDATLKRLELFEMKQRMPHELSQGQAQRVSIARAVVHAPKLILADEPTSSLDDDNCERVMDLIQEIAREEGTSLLVSTHDGRIKHRFTRSLSIEEMRA